MRSFGTAFALLATTLVGCTFDANTPAATRDADNTVAPTFDADPTAPDSSPPPDAALPCSEFVSAHFDACLLTTPGPELDLNMVGDYLYNTDDGTLEDPMGGFVTHQSETIEIGGILSRVVSVDSLAIGGDAVLRGQGTLPLVVASWGDINVAGIVDFDSRRGRSSGAGADPTVCASNRAIGGESDSSGGAGGGGGGFGGNGGTGGNGDSDNTQSTGGAGGSALAQPPQNVRGGCPSAGGGDGLSSAASGSSGGGAVQFVSKTSIFVSGVISAGGAGGEGGPTDSRAGGSGGGSGGYIGLQAPAIEFTDAARLTANGGGGGEGTSSSRTGDDGQDSRRSSNRANGGSGESDFGTDGGRGGAGSTLSGETVSSVLASGGGGGGGGVGFILLRTPSLVANDALLSPAATSL